MNSKLKSNNLFPVFKSFLHFEKYKQNGFLKSNLTQEEENK